jgi:uncharacterized protein with PIN domain
MGNTRAMRFIADAMLGRLARWLRILGFDTLYDPDIEDRDLLKRAREEDRVVLTRDTRISRKGLPGVVLVRSDHLEEQLAQVLLDCGLEPGGEPRCANCNGDLLAVAEKEDIRDAVPEYVYLSHAAFRRCSRCGNVYWEGSQYRRLREKLSRMAPGGGK